MSADYLRAHDVIAEATADRVTWEDGTEYISVEDAAKILAARVAEVERERDNWREDFGQSTEATMRALDRADRAEAKVRAVEALIDKWDDVTTARHIYWGAVPELRAALGGEAVGRDV